MATMPSHGLRHVTSVRPWLRNFQSATTVAAVSSSPSTEDLERAESEPKATAKGGSYFPKRGQTLELVCESLAFKGKGLCKVSETGSWLCVTGLCPVSASLGASLARKGPMLRFIIVRLTIMIFMTLILHNHVIKY